MPKIYHLDILRIETDELVSKLFSNLNSAMMSDAELERQLSDAELERQLIEEFEHWRRLQDNGQQPFEDDKDIAIEDEA